MHELSWSILITMSPGIQIGPLAFSFSLLLVLGSAAAAFVVGRQLSRSSAPEVESLLWQTFIVGLVAARLAFVAQYRDAYLASPLSIVDIRDGGWTPVAGFIGAALFAFVRQLRRPSIRTPLWSAFVTGAVIWGVGTLALNFGTAERQTLPPIALISIDGTPVKLDDFKGKPTVVNLWATWCPPCVREMPVLHQAQVDHPAVNFVFVNAGESAERVHAWLQMRKLPLRNVLLDATNQTTAHFKTPGFPTTLFFDAGGALVSVRVGEVSRATLMERLQVL
jgi:thiol-disulfide isomerase/thioredoxin